MAIELKKLRREMTAVPPQSAQSWYRRIDLTILKAVIRYVQGPGKTIVIEYDEITFQHAKHKCVNSLALIR